MCGRAEFELGLQSPSGTGMGETDLRGTYLLFLYDRTKSLPSVHLGNTFTSLLTTFRSRQIPSPPLLKRKLPRLFTQDLRPECFIQTSHGVYFYRDDIFFAFAEQWRR